MVVITACALSDDQAACANPERLAETILEAMNSPMGGTGTQQRGCHHERMVTGELKAKIDAV